uniref:Uncharacterized protein n=1 Tax=Oryza punctata TaxID=4537 RepID=A0A0E0LTG8_ORYPU
MAPRVGSDGLGAKRFRHAHALRHNTIKVRRQRLGANGFRHTHTLRQSTNKVRRQGLGANRFRLTHTLRHSTNKVRRQGLGVKIGYLKAVGLRSHPSLWSLSPYPSPSPQYHVKDWGRIGYATPIPFAKVPIRYGAKGWGRIGFATPIPFAIVWSQGLEMKRLRHTHALRHTTNKVRRQGLRANSKVRRQGLGAKRFRHAHALRHDTIARQRALGL